MSRITEYNAVTTTNGLTSLNDSNVFIIDGNNGNYKITTSVLADALLDKFVKNSSDSTYSKNSLYRGANLGSGATFEQASTAAQRTAISNGTFEGLFIGDYWTVNGKVYRIADFNYWYNVGDTNFATNHIVLVPDASFGNGKMNSTNVTTGGYVGSLMYTDENSVLNTARTTIATDFGGYLANHRLYLCNSVSSGKELGFAWVNSTVDLMSEMMVYGDRIKNSANSVTTEKTQLSLFKLNPKSINARYTYWLRDVVSATVFAYVGHDGNADATGASSSRGVRPAFAVKGSTS